MALLTILDANRPDQNETLRRKSRPVEAVTPRIRTLLEDMYETMLDAAGVGLAAPQVGVLRRVVVIQIPDGERLFLVNPVIVESSGEQEGQEGCLSVPGDCGIVRRPASVTVKAWDENGDEKTVQGEGLLARALCHEIDHLDGILYTDKAERMLTPEELDELNGGEAGSGPEDPEPAKPKKYRLRKK